MVGKRDADDIWMDPEEEGATAPAATATATEPVGTSTDTFGDDDPGAPAAWDDEDDGRQKRTVLIAQIALVVLVLLGVVVVLAVKSGDDDGGDDASKTTNTEATDGSTKTTDASGKPVPARFPAAVDGRPPALGKRGETADKVKSTAKPGVYVWSDFDGWHMWVVGGQGMPETVTGTLLANDEFTRADPANPSAKVDLAGKQVNYELPTDVPITGVDFNTGFFTNRMVFTLNGPEGPIDAKLIHTGKQGATPQYPLVIQKEQPK